MPEDHLAWFVLDLVDQLDLSAFYDRYRPDGRGGAAYDPAVMLAVVVYAYCVGDRSSRLVERRLAEDVAYRVVAANARPDHATIARFRAEHETALAGLFTQVLALCAQAGLVRVGLVALDGTKLEAAASKAANMDQDRLARALADQARRIIEEAKAVDAAEDELYGDSRGDELPPELADRSQRLARLRAAKAHLDAAQARRDAEQAGRKEAEQARRAAGKPRLGRPPTKDPTPKPLLVNTTDPDSGLMKVPGGFCQGYNAQAVATEDQILVAAELSNRAVDVGQLESMVAAVLANLVAAGVDGAVGTLVADAGYYSADNASLDTGVELLIATTKEHKLPTTPPVVVDPAVGMAPAETERAAHLAGLFERQAVGELTMRQVMVETGMAQSTAYVWRDRWRRGGVDALIRARRVTDAPPSLPPRTKIRLAMEARLASEEGRATYRRRSQLIEPVFGQIKAPRGIRRFQRRGLSACQSEWKLIAATHNVLKLWRRTTSPALA